MQSPWNVLTQRRKTAAEIADDKSRMNLTEEVASLKSRVGESEQRHADTATYLTGTPADLTPTDDNIPPAPPANLTVTPVPYGELDASWDTPPGADYVTKSVMEVTPQGGSAFTVNGATLFAYANNLTGGLPHSVRVKLVDRWGHESTWSAPVSATPLLTIREQINLDEMALNSRIVGLLPNANLAPIGDPSKFTAGVVENVALAAGQSANVLPFSEAEFENWADLASWPPAGVSAAFGSGVTAQVKQVASRKWLRQTRSPSSTGDYLDAFNTLAERGTVGSNYYIFSSYVRNPGASPVQVTLEVFDSASSTIGSEASLSSSTTATIPADGNEYRVWVKFQKNPARPFIRFRHHLLTISASVDWSRRQLEAIDATKSQPSAYSVPAASFGALSGYLLGVMDVAAVNAVFGDASIGNAKIQSLAVDKLVAGTFSAGTMTLAASGTIQAGPGVTLASGGLTLSPATAFGVPAAEAEYKITPPGNWGSMHFFDDGLNVRGAAIDIASISGRTARVSLRANPVSGIVNQLLLVAGGGSNLYAATNIDMFVNNTRQMNLTSNSVRFENSQVQADLGVVLKASNGSLWKIVVSTTGALSTVAA